MTNFLISNVTAIKDCTGQVVRRYLTGTEAGQKVVKVLNKDGELEAKLIGEGAERIREAYSRGSLLFSSKVKTTRVQNGNKEIITRVSENPTKDSWGNYDSNRKVTKVNVREYAGDNKELTTAYQRLSKAEIYPNGRGYCSVYCDTEMRIIPGEGNLKGIYDSNGYLVNKPKEASCIRRYSANESEQQVITSGHYQEGFSQKQSNTHAFLEKDAWYSDVDPTGQHLDMEASLRYQIYPRMNDKVTPDANLAPKLKIK